MIIVTTFLLEAAFFLTASGIHTKPGGPARASAPTTDSIDMFLNETAPACTTSDIEIGTRNGLIDPYYRWRHFYIHPDSAFNYHELRAINDAMYNLAKVIPCVEFGIWPRYSFPIGDYIHIIKGRHNGCNSAIGRQGGRQVMNLESPSCMGIGTIMHEMIHALGFHHEHGRYDRDDYVNINWENIEDGYEDAFDIYPSNKFTTYDIPYNYRSIMHYDSYSFSANGLPTITTKSGGIIRPSRELQFTDIVKLKISSREKMLGPPILTPLWK